MRKALVLLLALVVTSVAVMVGAMAVILPTRDQVTLTETTLYGDRTAAEGADVTIRTTYDNYLFWDTRSTLGTGLTVETDYRFYLTPQRESRHFLNRSVGLAWEFSYFETYRRDAEEMGAEMGAEPEALNRISAVWTELEERAAVAGEASQVIYLTDYFDYYPLGGWVDLPHIAFSWSAGGLVYGEVEAEETLEYEVAQAFRDFFRIPVLEEEQAELRVNNQHGNQSWGYDYGSLEADSFYLWSESIYTDDAAYFTFDCYTTNGNLIDTSHIPGGYGVYALPCDLDAVYPQELAMVYPLDPADHLLYLSCSPDQTKLLIHQRVDNTYVITVVDLADMTTLQRLEVGQWREDGYGGITLREGDDFLLAVLDYEELFVLAYTEDGSYELRIAAPVLPAEIGEGEQDDFYRSWEDNTALDYDGTRLVATSFLPTEDSWWYSCDFYLAVYDAGGLQYYGKYASSLSAGNSSLNTNYNCTPLNYDPIAVTWKWT